jgi:hypothetical protein
MGYTCGTYSYGVELRTGFWLVQLVQLMVGTSGSILLNRR